MCCSGKKCTNICSRLHTSSSHSQSELRLLPCEAYTRGSSTCSISHISSCTQHNLDHTTYVTHESHDDATHGLWCMVGHQRLACAMVFLEQSIRPADYAQDIPDGAAHIAPFVRNSVPAWEVSVRCRRGSFELPCELASYPCGNFGPLGLT